MFALLIVIMAVLSLVNVNAPGDTSWVSWLWLALGLHLLIGDWLPRPWARRDAP